MKLYLAIRDSMPWMLLNQNTSHYPHYTLALNQNTIFFNNHTEEIFLNSTFQCSSTTTTIPTSTTATPSTQSTSIIWYVLRTNCTNPPTIIYPNSQRRWRTRPTIDHNTRVFFTWSPANSTTIGTCWSSTAIGKPPMVVAPFFVLHYSHFYDIFGWSLWIFSNNPRQLLLRTSSAAASNSRLRSSKWRSVQPI